MVSVTFQDQSFGVCIVRCIRTDLSRLKILVSLQIRRDYKYLELPCHLHHLLLLDHVEAFSMVIDSTSTNVPYLEQLGSKGSFRRHSC